VSAVAIAFTTLLFMPTIADQDLTELLRRHFTAKTEADRVRAQKEILAIDGLTPAKLAEAIKGLKLWSKQQTGEYETKLRLRKGKASEMSLSVRVPEAYDPEEAWPLIIVLHGQGGKAEHMLRLTVQLLGSAADQFIIAAPQDLGPLGFTLPTDVVSRPRNLLNALRRTFHISSDHVYLVGYSQGSHDAWMASLMHSDCFAGVVPLATPLQLVGGDLLYDEVLPNTRNLAILFCWGKGDTLDAEGKPHPAGGNAAGCRSMCAVISALGFKHFEAVELEGVGHLGVAPPADRFAALLSQKRAHYPKRVRQAFRLPDQSDAYWIGAEELQGEPLSDGTLSIPIAEGEDPRAAKRKWLIDKLGLVEGDCTGQTVNITARHTPRVVLLLSDELLDLSKPVKIMRGKKKLFEGKVERDMAVMLAEAARGWDFDRLPVARAVVPLGGKVKFGYPTADKQKTKKSKPDRKDQDKVK
jgi:pimeloyl-ACP methyl ester carboxylesterase